MIDERQNPLAKDIGDIMFQSLQYGYWATKDDAEARGIRCSDAEAYHAGMQFALADAKAMLYRIVDRSPFSEEALRSARSAIPARRVPEDAPESMRLVGAEIRKKELETAAQFMRRVSKGAVK